MTEHGRALDYNRETWMEAARRGLQSGTYEFDDFMARRLLCFSEDMVTALLPKLHLARQLIAEMTSHNWGLNVSHAFDALDEAERSCRLALRAILRPRARGGDHGRRSERPRPRAGTADAGGRHG